jgi:hypothetical protein
LLYTFINGHIMDVPEFATPKSMELMFKVNLPSTEADVENGNGEGVWACTDEQSRLKWESETCNEIIFVRILNDSIYYPTLKCDTIIPVRLCQDMRPVALLDELIAQNGKSKRDEVLRFMKK